MSQLMEMEVIHIVQLLPGCPAHAADRCGGFISALWPQADEGNQIVVLRGLLCSWQRIDLIICAILLFDDAVIVLTVKRPVLDTVKHLFLFRCPQDRRQGIAEIHGSDFLALGGADLGFLPGGVVPHTAADCQALLIQVNILPCQAASLTDTKSGEICDLDRQKRRIAFFLQKFDQLGILLVVDGRGFVQRLTLSIFREHFIVLVIRASYHILHRVEGNQLLGKDCEAEGVVQHRRILAHRTNA